MQTIPFEAIYRVADLRYVLSVVRYAYERPRKTLMKPPKDNILRGGYILQQMTDDYTIYKGY